MQSWRLCVGIEREPVYAAIARDRIDTAMGRGKGSLFAEVPA